MDNDEQEYFKALAGQLVSDVSSAEQVYRFTRNMDVVGAFAESLVYQFVSKVVHPLRISSGTVISKDSYKAKKTTPQLDLIIWDPNPVPPIVAEERFALVPRNSVLGIIEVKKTDYSGGLNSINKKIDEVDECFPLNSINKLFLGVICAATKYDPNGENKLSEMIGNKRVVCLLDYRGDKPIPNSEGIYRLINFLGAVRIESIKRKAKFAVNYPGSEW
ncbi:MAG: DUF6602 domain-containing protein [Candidatus Thiodiazotropha endolucinida]